MNVLLVPAHPGFPGQIPQSRKTVVCVCVNMFYLVWYKTHPIPKTSAIPSADYSDEFDNDENDHDYGEDSTPSFTTESENQSNNQQPKPADNALKNNGGSSRAKRAAAQKPKPSTTVSV